MADIKAPRTVADIKAPRTVADIKVPRTVAETDNKALRTVPRAKTEIHCTEVTTLELATEAAAAEQQATAEDQRLQSGRPTARSWEAEDMRPVQAEPAERKHGRKGASAEVEEARAGRALPAPTKQHPRRRSPTASTQRAHARTHVHAGSVPGHRVPTAILFRTGPP